MYKRLAICLSLVFMVACQDLTVKDQGSIAGGLIGGVVGKQVTQGSTLGVISGSLIGSYLGGEIAQSMQAYRKKISHTMEVSRSQVSTVWENPDQHTRYVLIPEAAAKAEGRICRPFKLLIESKGQTRLTRGHACREAKDEWRIFWDE